MRICDKSVDSDSIANQRQHVRHFSSDSHLYIIRSNEHIYTNWIHYVPKPTLTFTNTYDIIYTHTKYPDTYTLMFRGVCAFFSITSKHKRTRVAWCACACYSKIAHTFALEITHVCVVRTQLMLCNARKHTHTPTHA